MPVTIQSPLFDFRSVVVPTDLAPSVQHQDFVRGVLDSRYTELEKHIMYFRECGVDLDRMHIVHSRDYSTSTLHVDGIARFQWRIKGYFDAR